MAVDVYSCSRQSLLSNTGANNLSRDIHQIVPLIVHQNNLYKYDAPATKLAPVIYALPERKQCTTVSAETSYFTAVDLASIFSLLRTFSLCYTLQGEKHHIIPVALQKQNLHHAAIVVAAAELMQQAIFAWGLLW